MIKFGLMKLLSKKQFEAEKWGQSGLGRMPLLVTIGVFALVLCVWRLGERAGRNDYLQREAKFLAGSRQIWLQQTLSNAAPRLPSYTVNNRSGTVVLINEEVIVDGQSQVAELGWTNSCLGRGTLIVTSSNIFLWREPNGTTRKLNIPNLSRIPLWWYLTSP
jgi:hypothetical protein